MRVELHSIFLFLALGPGGPFCSFFCLDTKGKNQRKNQGYRKIDCVFVHSAKTNELGAIPLKQRLFFNASFTHT